MTLRDNLQRVQDRIAAAAARAGRDVSAITLVAVSKTQPVAAVLEAYELGVRHFGENRVEEAAIKLPQFMAAVAEPGVAFDMIGHVQSRKAAAVAAMFDRVQAVDSLKLLQRLDRAAADAGKILPVLLEINVSGEASKYGLAVAARAELDAVLAAASALSHVRLEGLMTMAPLSPTPEAARPVFAGLRALRDDLVARQPWLTLPQLSMGMTDDFEIAIEEGATLVRIGRAIFTI